MIAILNVRILSDNDKWSIIHPIYSPPPPKYKYFYSDLNPAIKHDTA